MKSSGVLLAVKSVCVLLIALAPTGLAQNAPQGGERSFTTAGFRPSIGTQGLGSP